MEITWADIINLTTRLFELTQYELAELLEIKPSSISRVINGNQYGLRTKRKKYYECLFDPNNAKSPAHSKNPEELLKDLKEAINEAGLTDATKDLPKDDYKKFVLGLFKLADENKLRQYKQKKDAFPIITKDNEESNINQTDSQNTFSGAQLAIPQDCKICLFCENWKGDAHDALESTSGAYGRCIHLRKDILSQEMKCEGFKENWGLITKYIYSHHDMTKF